MVKVKPEVRVLAVTGVKPLKVFPRIPLLGVVFRGCFWLDGLLKTSFSLQSNPLRALSRMVKRSSHYGQVRVVLLDAGFPWRAGGEEWKKLAENLNRPLILFCERRAAGCRPVELFGKAKVWLEAFGLTLEEAGEVVRVSTVEPPLPEPLRVARMLAKAYDRLLRVEIPPFHGNRNL